MIKDTFLEGVSVRLLMNIRETKDKQQCEQQEITSIETSNQPHL